MKTMNTIILKKKQLPAPGNPINWEIAVMMGLWMMAVIMALIIGNMLNNIK